VRRRRNRGRRRSPLGRLSMYPAPAENSSEPPFSADLTGTLLIFGWIQCAALDSHKQCLEVARNVRQAVEWNLFEKARWQQRGEFAGQRMPASRYGGSHESSQLIERLGTRGRRRDGGTEALLHLLAQLKDQADALNERRNQPGQAAARGVHGAAEVSLAQSGQRFGGEEMALKMFESTFAQGFTIAERSVK